MNIKLLTISDAATRLGVSAPTIYKLVQNKKIGHKRIGIRIFFSEENIAEFIKVSNIPLNRKRKVPENHIVDPPRRGPLGYVVIGGKLHIEPNEAKLVKFIFACLCNLETLNA